MVVDALVEFSFTNNFETAMYKASVSAAEDMYDIRSSITLDCTGVPQNNTCYGYMTGPDAGGDPFYFSLSNNDDTNLIKISVSNPLPLVK